MPRCLLLSNCQTNTQRVLCTAALQDFAILKLLGRLGMQVRQETHPKDHRQLRKLHVGGASSKQTPTAAALG
jgi:hypothetical protein